MTPFCLALAEGGNAFGPKAIWDAASLPNRGIICLLLGLLVAGILWLLFGRKAAGIAPTKRPVKEALRALKDLRNKADVMRPSEVGHQVSEILRRFYEARYGLPAPYRTALHCTAPICAALHATPLHCTPLQCAACW